MKLHGKAGRRWLLSVLTVALACVVSAASPLAPEAAWREFWDAKSFKEAEQAANAVVKAGVDFNQAIAQLDRKSVV